MLPVAKLLLSNAPTSKTEEKDMGNKEEITNLIGRKGSKMTVNRLWKRKQRTGNGHPVNKIPGCGIPERGQGVSPCDAYLSVASVAKTTFRYKELHHKRSL